MSAPASGGRIVTLTPGQSAQLLTEYAGGNDNPLMIINNDVSAGRVYVGADSSVSTRSGVPIDPGTSLPWTIAGEVWAIADPAAIGPVSIILTTAVSDWTPSPAAIAALVAAELLATGVPNVITEHTIANGDPIAASGQKAYDVSGYASVAFVLTPTTAPTGLADATLRQSALGLTVRNDSFYFAVSAFPYLASRLQGTIAVVGDTLTVQAPAGGSGFGISVTLVGSNRAAREGLDVRSNAGLTDAWSTSVAPTAGNDYPLAQQDASVRLQGQAFATFVAGGVTALGFFELDFGPYAIVVADTTEMYTTGNNSARRVSRLIALPAQQFVVIFRCRQTGEPGTARTYSANFIPAQP